MSQERSSGGLLSVALIITTVVFVCLKLAREVDWSWWIVLLPFLLLLAFSLVPLLLVGGAVSVLGALAAIFALPSMWAERRRNRKRDADWERRDARWAAEQAQKKDAESSNR